MTVAVPGSRFQIETQMILEWHLKSANPNPHLVTIAGSLAHRLQSPLPTCSPILSLTPRVHCSWQLTSTYFLKFGLRFLPSECKQQYLTDNLSSLLKGTPVAASKTGFLPPFFLLLSSLSACSHFGQAFELFSAVHTGDPLFLKPLPVGPVGLENLAHAHL